MIGGHTDDAWDIAPSSDPELMLSTIDDATRWVQERIEGRSNKDLDALVLDPDGAVCTWVKPEDADPTMLDAAISEGPIEHDPDDLEPAVHAGVSERLPHLPRELDFEMLGSEQASTGSREAIIAVPDVPGRLLKDALDKKGIRPARFTTIWHALCTAWDPGIGSSSGAQHIVSSDAPICSIIAIDPIDARMIWAWSREGQLICAGSVRLRRVFDEHEPRVLVRQTDIARLCADWLGWSSQLGISPSRIVVLGEPTTHEVEDDIPNPERPLDPGQLGTMLTLRWPDATLDLMGEPDPIGATLRKIAQQERCPAMGSLKGLEERPTRAHRSMFRWAGLALTGAACVVLLLGLQFMNRTNAIKQETRAIEMQQTEMLRTYDPDLMLSAAPVWDLESKRSEITRSSTLITVPKPKPVMKALETVSFVVGSPGIQVTNFNINSRTFTLLLQVDEVAEAEQLYQSLQSIDDSLLSWYSMNPQLKNGRVEATYLARWADPGEAGP